MPKVSIDISLFDSRTAFGRVSGSIEVVTIPQIGDRLSFSVSGRGKPAENVDLPLLIKVMDRIICANAEDDVLLLLEDIVAEKPEDARNLMSFFEESHGLLGEPYAPPSSSRA